LPFEGVLASPGPRAENREASPQQLAVAITLSLPDDRWPAARDGWTARWKSTASETGGCVVAADYARTHRPRERIRRGAAFHLMPDKAIGTRTDRRVPSVSPHPVTVNQDRRRIHRHALTRLPKNELRQWPVLTKKPQSRRKSRHIKAVTVTPLVEGQEPLGVRSKVVADRHPAALALPPLAGREAPNTAHRPQKGDRPEPQWRAVPPSRQQAAGEQSVPCTSETRLRSARLVLN
jgi:hypothetical protein